MSAIKDVLAKIAEDYTVRNGIIRSPGKFEGEPVEVVYWYDSDGADEDGEGWVAIRVTDEEREAFGLEPDAEFAVIEESDQGFIHLTYATVTDVDRLIEEDDISRISTCNHCGNTDVHTVEDKYGDSICDDCAEANPSDVARVTESTVDENKRFYLTPRVREFANECEYAYIFDGTKDEADAIAEEHDCRIRTAAEIEALQEAMHLAEGCSHRNCSVSTDFDPSEETCNFQVKDADEFCDEIPESWVEEDNPD